MKKFITSLLFLSLLSASALSQVVTSTIYSPILGREIDIPYAETDFLSIRMRGLGYQLHNVVDDTVTNLFRNPVSIYGLNKSLLIANYENNQDVESIIIRPSSMEIIGFEVTNPGGIIIAGDRYNQGSNQSSLYENNSSYAVSSAVQPFFEKDFYVSLGYWSPKLWGTIPVGLFLKGNLVTSENRLEYFPPLTDPFNENDDINKRDSSTKNKEFYGKIWLGMLNKPNLQFGFSYDLQYFSTIAERQSQQIRIWTTQYDYRIDKLFGIHDSDYDWIRHRFSLGSSLNWGEWAIEPEIAGLAFTNDEKFDREDFGESVRYASVNMDSLLNFGERRMITNWDFERDINGFELDLQAQRNELVLFLTGSILNVSPKEFSKSEDEVFDFDYGDTTRNDYLKSRFQFNDNGMLYRGRFGMGKQFTVTNRFRIYSAAVVEYFRNQLSGDLSFAGTKNLFNYSDTSFVDTSYNSLLDYTSQQWRLSLPIGFEFSTKVFSARLGLNWYYRKDKLETGYDYPGRSQDFLKERSASNFTGEEFFGFGLKWKGAQLNIAALSEVFRFSSWHVGLRYSF